MICALEMVVVLSFLINEQDQGWQHARDNRAIETRWLTGEEIKRKLRTN